MRRGGELFVREAGVGVLGRGEGVRVMFTGFGRFCARRGLLISLCARESNSCCVAAWVGDC